MRIALLVEYEGANYAGWQRQDNAMTVQESIEKALYRLNGNQVHLTGAGRTDAGVNALGQVAHFDTAAAIPPDKYSFALNGLLPPDIRIRRSVQVADDFHARFGAVEKAYRYAFYNARHHSALYRNLCFHVPLQLDETAMEKAAFQLVGENDFAAFMAAGSAVQDTVRRVTNVKIWRQGDFVFYEVVANGFLYNMVRIMAGTLMEIGLGKRSADSISDLISGRDRKPAGITAPPQGLTMLWVRYEENPFGETIGESFSAALLS